MIKIELCGAPVSAERNSATAKARAGKIIPLFPYIAFEVDDIYEAIKGRKVLIEPNSPFEGNMVAFIEENGVPI